jgi:hypothetical protein
MTIIPDNTGISYFLHIALLMKAAYSLLDTPINLNFLKHPERTS